MVHRVMLKPAWHAFNRLTRYSLTTTLHWLNFSTQAYRKLKQLHRHQPFDLIQYPNYSSCGLFSIPFLRTAHVVRASSISRPWRCVGVKRNLDSLVDRTSRSAAIQTHSKCLHSEQRYAEDTGEQNARARRASDSYAFLRRDSRLGQHGLRSISQGTRNTCSISAVFSCTKVFTRSRTRCRAF